MAVDFSKAFDTVNHTALLCSLTSTSLPPNDLFKMAFHLPARPDSVLQLQ